MEKFGYKFDAITLIVMGRLKPAASGCYCPENVFLRRLLRHLVTGREEVVVVDMEAGIEHLTRGTAEAVDAFIVVVEPGQRSIQTARTVLNLAQDLGVKKVFAVGNKIRDGRDMRFLTGHLSDINFIGAIPLTQSLVDADMNGLTPYAGAPDIVEHVKGVKDHLKAA
jgi:CO dehydrogenase maturation factor